MLAHLNYTTMPLLHQFSLENKFVYLSTPAEETGAGSQEDTSGLLIGGHQFACDRDDPGQTWEDVWKVVRAALNSGGQKCATLIKTHKRVSTTVDTCQKRTYFAVSAKGVTSGSSLFCILYTSFLTIVLLWCPPDTSLRTSAYIFSFQAKVVGGRYSTSFASAAASPKHTEGSKSQRSIGVHYR